jgi:glycerol-3-phosphate acyltransferase PlsY
MEDVLLSLLVIISAYLFGSIPSAYLAGRLVKKTDIRQIGTRNMGAMNTFYQIGFWVGFSVLLMDIGKGVAALALARALEVPEGVLLLCGFMVIVGHNWPVWLKFHGGKGGASLIGVLSFIMPWGFPIGFGIFLLLMAITRFPTFSYGIALWVFPFVAWFIYDDFGLVLYSIGILSFLLLRYSPRIKEIYSRAGNVKHALKRKSLKDRM